MERLFMSVNSATTPAQTLQQSTETIQPAQPGQPTAPPSNSGFNNLLSGAGDLFRQATEVVSDPRAQAVARVAGRNPQLAGLLIRIGASGNNFSLNDISRDEVLLIANNIDLMEETGLLQSISSELPSSVNKILEFRKNNPQLFRTGISLANRFPSVVDFGLRAGRFFSSEAVSNFIENVSSRVRAIPQHVGTFINSASLSLQSVYERAGNLFNRGINAIRFW